MDWDYKFTSKAFKQLRKLGHEPSRRIVRFLKNRIQGTDDPRQFGKSLKGDLGEFWRYRVDDFRILCVIQDEELVVLVVKVSHRSSAYD